jgi:hypothetical protein
MTQPLSCAWRAFQRQASVDGEYEIDGGDKHKHPFPGNPDVTWLQEHSTRRRH